MELRLNRFDGLQINLDRGWYVVPSHMSFGEVRRLTDILRDGVHGVRHVVELSSFEWDEIAPGLTSATLVHLQVHNKDSLVEVESLIVGRDIRLGLIHLPGGDHWPDQAWDELEVKSALVRWCRREFASREHPLTAAGIAKLPLDIIAACTSEAVEFLELVEATIRRGPDRGAVAGERWIQPAYASIAERLAVRLRTHDHSTDEAMAGPLVERLTPNELATVLLGTESGHLRASMHRTAAIELERKGLAIRSGDDLMLGPLARSLKLPRVRAEFIERFFPIQLDYR